MLSFFLTLVVEGPFAWLALRYSAANRFRKVSVFVSANAISYCLLIPFYLMSSAFSFYTTLALDRSAIRPDKTPVLVYFISLDDYRLYRISTSEVNQERISDMPYSIENSWYSGLFYRENSDSTAWNLMLGDHRLRSGYYRMEDTVVIHNFIPLANYRYPEMPDYLRRYSTPLQWRRQHEEQLLQSRGRGQVIPPSDSPPYSIFYGNWAAEGLSITHQPSGSRFNFAIEVPYRMWPAKFPTLIPDNRIIYQLGDYIVLVDLDSMRVAYLAHGFSPLVVLQGDLVGSDVRPQGAH